MKTGLINKIRIHATASTAIPTIPALYANVASWSGSKAFGSLQNGDDFNMGGGDVTFEEENEKHLVRPVRGKAIYGVVPIFRAITRIEFDALDISEALYTLDSQFVIASNIGAPDEEQTLRSVIVEYDGIAFDYFPACAVTVGPPMGNYKDKTAAAGIVAIPTATTACPSGMKRYFYVAA